MSLCRPENSDILKLLLRLRWWWWWWCWWWDSKSNGWHVLWSSSGFWVYCFSAAAILPSDSGWICGAILYVPRDHRTEVWGVSSRHGLVFVAHFRVGGGRECVNCFWFVRSVPVLQMDFLISLERFCRFLKVPKGNSNCMCIYSKVREFTRLLVSNFSST